MASIETLLVVEEEKTARTPPPGAKALKDAATTDDYFPVVNVVLRLLLFASALVAVVVMATSKQTRLVAIPFPPFQASLTAEFTDSPAFIYFIAALSVTGLYGIITTLLSVYTLLNPSSSKQILPHFVILDVLLLGTVAAATGTAGAVAYIGLKGNSHVRWQKMCDTYGSFCRHIASSAAVSLFGCVVLVLLVLLSLHSISKKIPK